MTDERPDLPIRGTVPDLGQVAAARAAAQQQGNQRVEVALDKVVVTWMNGDKKTIFMYREGTAPSPNDYLGFNFNTQAGATFNQRDGRTTFIPPTAVRSITLVPPKEDETEEVHDGELDEGDIVATPI